MPNGKILESRPYLLGIELEKPFPLGFGTLSHLPRVLFQITALENGQLVKGIGEASIDFPFSHYDAFDIYKVLSALRLEDQDLNDREKILNSPELRESLLFETPAAFTAVNMALDDLVGKVAGQNVMDFYGRRRDSAQALASISFQENALMVVKETEEKFRQGYIPKPKVGRGVEEDVRTVVALEQSAEQANFAYVLDFNAQYSVEDSERLLCELKRQGICLNHTLFIEQPTRAEDGVEGLIAFRALFGEIMGREITVIADESFVTLDDAMACARGGIDLNFKIHKVGGLYYAREIEKQLLKAALLKQNSMVGGTFPTAIGRVYDQQSAAVLQSTGMPGDGLEPSTDWFTGQKHLIQEEFEPADAQGNFAPKTGPGLGVTPNWHNIDNFIIKDPFDEYRRIRAGRAGKRISIQLKAGQTYGTIYEALSGKRPDWNLD